MLESISISSLLIAYQANKLHFVNNFFVSRIAVAEADCSTTSVTHFSQAVFDGS